MQNPNLPPGAQPVPPGGPQPPQKLTKEQKKALAEQQKRIQQEKMRTLELTKLVANFSRELADSVIDTPMMYKLGANRIKMMLKADHASVALFEEYPELGKICLIREQSNLPQAQEKKATKDDDEDDKKGKKDPKGQKEPKAPPPKVEEKAKVPVPKPPPKEPLKPGQLPDLEGVFIHAVLPMLEQVRAGNKPLMIPDAAADKGCQQFAAWYSIKSMLLLPLVVNGEVTGVVGVYKTTTPQIYTQLEITHTQKAIEVLARSVETAPPILPDKIKDKVISKMIKADNSSNLMEYYSELLDDVFHFMIGELEEAEATELVNLLEEQKVTDNRLRKVWYQLGKFIEFTDKPELAYLCNIGISEMADQAIEYVEYKQASEPAGLSSLKKILGKMLKRPPLLESPKGPDDEEFDSDTIMEEIDTEISKSVRGELLFSDQKKATLINDVEQSEMLVNFISVGAAMDFRQHIQANLPEAPEEVDVDELMAQLSHQGMREISQVVAQNLAEKYLYAMAGFLEKPEEFQKEQMSRLRTYIHYRTMANLVPTLRGRSSLWGKMIAERIKERTLKAAKQRAILVGRMARDTGGDEEDEDWEE